VVLENGDEVKVKKNSVKERLQANDQLNKLMGLYHPQVIHHSGEVTHEHKVTIEYSKNWRDQLATGAARN